MKTRQSAGALELEILASRSEEYVMLVDDADVQTGVASKASVHRTGQLHRAVSVFLFDDRGRVLLQQRSSRKYHSPGRWSNTCCGHPRPGETTLAAAQRRLLEEMGIEAALSPSFKFTYRAELGDELIEHEVDHVFTGVFNGTPVPDPREVGAWGWMAAATLIDECRANPLRYSAWLGTALANFPCFVGA